MLDGYYCSICPRFVYDAFLERETDRVSDIFLTFNPPYFLDALYIKFSYTIGL